MSRSEGEAPSLSTQVGSRSGRRGMGRGSEEDEVVVNVTLFGSGTQFTCFAGTKVRILTPEEQSSRVLAGGGSKRGVFTTAT
jgi:hypothetical protein